ncbi:MAG: hypothetical protein AAGH65_06125 [Pseudomonadota bacterium]
MKITSFAALQRVENLLIPELVHSAGVDWLIEMAPLTSPSPALNLVRHRVMLDEHGWAWPFQSPTLSLPFRDEEFPAILMRHMFQPGVQPNVLDEALRCLMPGGLLISVSANPWHRAAWQAMGRKALQLPAWPQLLYRCNQHHLEIQLAGHQSWRGLVPGLSPVLVMVARKPPRAAKVTKLKFPEIRSAAAALSASQCRAA